MCVEQFSAGKYLHLGPSKRMEVNAVLVLSWTPTFNSSTGDQVMFLLYVVSSYQIWLNSFPSHCQIPSMIRCQYFKTDWGLPWCYFPIQRHFEKSFFIIIVTNKHSRITYSIAVMPTFCSKAKTDSNSSFWDWFLSNTDIWDFNLCSVIYFGLSIWLYTTSLVVSLYLCSLFWRAVLFPF